jgi:hypothetical protein
MTPQGHIDYDPSLWPLLLIRYEGIMTNQQIVQALEQRTRYLERREPCVVIHDMTRANEFASVEQRRMQTEWLKAHDAQLRQWVLGVAFVMTSVAMRLIVSLTIRIKPLAMPHQVFKHLPEAAIWSAGWLQLAGLKNQHILAHYAASPHAHAP